MLPQSVIAGAVVGGIYGATSAAGFGVRDFPGIAGFATPYLILGALIGYVLHLIFFRK